MTTCPYYERVLYFQHDYLSTFSWSAMASRYSEKLIQARLDWVTLGEL